jgi:hypothetical protein
MLANTLRPTPERLDKIYFCKTCQIVFLFKSDVEDHMQGIPRHQVFASKPLK